MKTANKVNLLLPPTPHGKKDLKKNKTLPSDVCRQRCSYINLRFPVHTLDPLNVAIHTNYSSKDLGSKSYFNVTKTTDSGLVTLYSSSG